MQRMINLAMFINPLGGVDIAFFVICAVIIALGVGIYFLIPVLNKKQYQEQRENLRKREEAFKSNYTASTPATSQSPEEEPTQPKSDESNDSK